MQVLGNTQNIGHSLQDTKICLAIICCSLICSQCADYTSTVADLVHTKSNLVQFYPSHVLMHVFLRNLLTMSRLRAQIWRRHHQMLIEVFCLYMDLARCIEAHEHSTFCCADDFGCLAGSRWLERLSEVSQGQLHFVRTTECSLGCSLLCRELRLHCRLLCHICL